MNNRVEIYDTTLRDGSQGLGIFFSVLDKLRIAERLDAFGVHYIEGWLAGSNPKDIEFFEEAKRRTFPSCEARRLWGDAAAKVSPRGRRSGQAADRRRNAGSDDRRQTSLLHVREVLQTTPEENLAMIADTVAFLKAQGRFVVYDADTRSTL